MAPKAPKRRRATSKGDSAPKEGPNGGELAVERGSVSGMPLVETLTAQDVIGLWTYRMAQADDAGLRVYIKEARELYNLQRVPQIPNEYKVIAGQGVRTPYYRDAVDRIAASLVKDPPVPMVEPRDETTPVKRAADIATRWIDAGFKLMDKERQQNTIFESARSLVRDTESIIKCVHRPDAWANFPVREGQVDYGDGRVTMPEDAGHYLERVKRYKQSKGVRFPFAWEPLDRLLTHWGEGEYGANWVIEYGTYNLAYLGRQYNWHPDMADPEYISPKVKLGGIPYPYGSTFTGTSNSSFNYGNSGTAGVARKWEYWDPNWWAVVIDGRMAPGFPKENPYAPWIPYMRAVAPPALYSLRYLVPSLDDLLTMQKGWAYLTAWPTPTLEDSVTGQQFPLDGLPTGDDGTRPKFKWSPGKLNVPPAGYKFAFMQPPPSGRDITEMTGMFQQLIDIAGISSIFRGMSPGSRTPGYAINQLMAAAGLEFRMLGEALQRQLENVAEFLLHCIANVDGLAGEEVYVLADGGE